MKNRLLSFIMAVLLCGLVSYHQEADASDPSLEFEQVFLDLVNQARANPKAAISAIGLDPAVVLAQSPDLAALFDGSLEPLSVDPRLAFAARDQVQDMLDRKYYAYASPEGITPSMRLADHGYRPVVSDQSLGLVLSRNYIPQMDALWRIFVGMLMDELDKKVSLKILNPDYRDLGFSFSSGQVDLGQGIQNVYVAVSNFAQSAEQYMEAVLLQKILKARQDPSAAFEEAGLDIEQIRLSWGSKARLMDHSLEPMSRDSKLDRAAGMHMADILEKIYFTPVSPEGITPEQRAAMSGYEAVHLAQAMSLAVLDEEAGYYPMAREIFLDLLAQEAFSTKGPLHILSPEFSQAGMSLAIFDQPGFEPGFVLASIKTAHPLDPLPYIVGGVFAWQKDQDDKLISFGVSGMGVDLVNFYTGELIQRTFSDFAGLFQIPGHDIGIARLNLIDESGKIIYTNILMPGFVNRRAEFWTNLENVDVQNKIRLF